jgi:DNA-binding transcriptional regulator YdaS (Cro superfamily)
LTTKYAPITALSNWLAVATPQMKQKLATLAESSECMFRQWVAGRRGMSAEKAGLVAAATNVIEAEFDAAPKALKRGELCDACRSCDYYNQIENSDLL